MKIVMDEAYVYRSGTITPLNEVDCTRDVETRPPNERLTQCKVIACTANMYSADQRAFIAREYWRTGSFKQCQGAFRNKYAEESVPTKPCFHKLVKKLETIGSILTRHAGGRKMCDRTVQDVKDRLLASPRKSLRRYSQETGIPYSTRQGAAKKAKLHPYRVSVVQGLLPTDLEKRLR
jgi:hypothetical protein